MLNDIKKANETRKIELKNSHPHIIIPEKIIGINYQQWEISLIISVFEAIGGIQTIKRRLQNLWKIGLHFQIKDLKMGFCIVYNLSKDERTFIITRRPWKPGSYPITVRSWKPTFSVVEEVKKITTTVWVNIIFLPIEFQSTEIMIALGNAMEKTLALDAMKSFSSS